MSFKYRISCCYPIFVVGAQRLHIRFASFSHYRILSHLQCTNRFTSHCHSTGQDGRSWKTIIRQFVLSVTSSSRSLTWIIVISSQFKETLLKRHIQCTDLSTWFASLFQIVNRSSTSNAIGSTS